MAKLALGATIFLVVVFLATGIAAAIISSRNIVDCGFNATVKPRDWLLGAGIGYIILGVLLGVSIFLGWVFEEQIPCSIMIYLIVLLTSGLFVVAWTIVGSVSLLRDGLDCANIINHEVWSTMLGMLIIWLITIVIELVLFPFAYNSWLD